MDQDTNTSTIAGELVFWTVCRGHVTDIGGPVPAGYNLDAKEIQAKFLRQGWRENDLPKLFHGMGCIDFIKA